jgi:DNA-directed RNA polymerase subunit N (RpoN/RPB10)
MLYMICSCGELLGNKELVYEEEMRNVCAELGIDSEMISRGMVNDNLEYKQKLQNIVGKLCRRYCCKMAMMNYVDIVNIIKG